MRERGRLLIGGILVLSLSAGLVIFLRSGNVQPRPQTGVPVANDGLSLASPVVGRTPIDAIERELSGDELKAASANAENVQEREIYLRGFWLNTRKADSASEIEPFLHIIADAPSQFWDKSDDTPSGPVDLVGFSLAVLVKQWHQGAPIESLAPDLERGARGCVTSDDEIVRLQAAMLLWIMEHSPRGHALSSASLKALREAEKNEWIAHQMDIQRTKVLGTLRTK